MDSIIKVMRTILYQIILFLAGIFLLPQVSGQEVIGDMVKTEKHGSFRKMH
jgi:hypothetical protein